MCDKHAYQEENSGYVADLLRVYGVRFNKLSIKLLNHSVSARNPNFNLPIQLLKLFRILLIDFIDFLFASRSFLLDRSSELDF
jgi:hypothetical protein